MSLFYGSLVEAFGVLFGKLALEFVQKLLALDEKFVCALSAFLSALITIFGTSSYYINLCKESIHNELRDPSNRNVRKSNCCVGIDIQLWRSNTFHALCCLLASPNHGLHFSRGNKILNARKIK